MAERARREDPVPAPDSGSPPQDAAAGGPPDERRPADLGDTVRALESVRIHSIALTLLLVLALLYTLYFARAFLLPIVIALLLTFLLSPSVRALSRWHIPTPLGSGLVILTLVGVVGIAVYELAEPAQQWFSKAPGAISSVGAKLHELKRPVEQVSRAAEQLEHAAAVATPEQQHREVVVRGPSLVSRVFGTTQALVAGILEVLVLLYFLLAVGDLFLEKLISVLPQLKDKKKAVRIARDTESSVSVYLSTVTLVNAAEGLVLGLCLWALGMPVPVLWGALAMVIEFVPYVGAVVMLATLTGVALSTFHSIAHALLVPAAFLAINLIQANLLTPVLMSRRLTLNPVAIVVGLAFWWWLWGVPGAFVAVPLLATLKIFCDHIESLAPIGEFLGK